MNDIANDPTISVGKLRAYIERIERLEEEKKSISSDIKDIFNEMKHEGFDVKATKEIIKLRRQEDDARKEIEALVELYKAALGMS